MRVFETGLDSQLSVPPMLSNIDDRTRNVAATLLLFLGVFLVFSQTITFDWVQYDDQPYVLENPMLNLPPVKAMERIFSEGYFGAYTPVTLLSHALDLRAWGPSPAGHHLTNVLLHSLNAVWVMLLALVLLRGVRGRGAGQGTAGMSAAASREELLTAFLAALLWAIHPLRAESVAWVSDRKDLLAAAFALPASILYLRDRFRNQFRVVSTKTLFCVLLFAIGALSKTSVVALAGVFLVLEITLFGFHKGWKERLHNALYAVPFLLVGFVVGLFAIGAAPESAIGYGVEKLSTPLRTLLPGYSLLFYPCKMLCPYPLVPFYLAPGGVLVVGAVLGCVLLGGVLVLAYRKGHFVLPLACAAYVILLYPTTSSFAAAIQPWADRYSYFPTIPLFLVAAYGILALADNSAGERIRRRRRTVVALASSLAGIMLVLTILQSRIWYNGLSLWSHQIAHGEHTSGALNNLGTAYLQVKEFQKAKDMFSEAIRNDPHDLEALLNLRIVANEPAHYKQLIVLYRNALRFEPGDARLHLALGEMYWADEKHDSCVMELRRTLEIDPGSGPALHDLGLWHQQCGRQDSARICFQHATSVSPGFAPPYASLGSIALAQHDTAEAITQLTIAARLGELSAKQMLRAMNRFW